MHHRVLIAALVWQVSFFALSQDDVVKQTPEEADLAAVQGMWERDFTDQAGKIVGRAVKHIEGRRETVTYYDSDDKVLQAHRVEIKLRREGGVRLFEHSEIEIIAGPRKGLKSDRRGAYVYKVEGDRFLEFQGILIRDAEQRADIRVWNRKEAKAAGQGDTE